MDSTKIHKLSEIMTTETLLEEKSTYKYGFVTPIETESFPKGLSEDTIRALSFKKGEPSFLLEFRLKAYHKWKEMKEPQWGNIKFTPIDYQNITYYSATKKK